MASAGYTYQLGNDGHAIDLPKKRFSIISLLFKLRRFAIFILIVIVTYQIWPQLHYDSYRCFKECLLIITSSDMFHIAVDNFREGFQIHPIARSVELFVLLAAIWKLIFRGKIRAFLRVNSIVMLFLACLWIHTILFRVIDIKAYPIWTEFLRFYSYSPMLVYLYPFGIDTAMEIYAVAVVLIVCYLFTVLFYGSVTKEGQRLDRYDMEQLGIDEVLSRVNPIRKLFLPRPRFYVTDSFSQNAYSSGSSVVIALDIFDEGIEVAQGVIAHELGHYYHYDTDARMICNVAINTVAFPFMLVTFVLRILAHIPFLGIAAGLYSIMISIFGAITGFVFNIINMLFYWIDGKWAERSADMFSVDLDYGFGNYLFLLEYTDGFSLRTLLSGFFDVHPVLRSRCRYIRKRIIRNYGDDYWDSYVSVYGDYYV